MSRRKFERPILKELEVWSAKHPVARSIASGSHWFEAWLGQKCTPYQVIARKAGISPERSYAIGRNAPITLAEVKALAALWHIEPDDLIASMSNPELVQG